MSVDTDKLKEYVEALAFVLHPSNLQWYEAEHPDLMAHLRRAVRDFLAESEVEPETTREYLIVAVDVPVSGNNPSRHWTAAIRAAVERKASELGIRSRVSHHILRPGGVQFPNQGTPTVEDWQTVDQVVQRLSREIRQFKTGL